MVKQKEKETTSKDRIRKQLEERGLLDIISVVDDALTSKLKVTSTSFPSLDELLHTKNLGLPHGIDVEIASRAGSAGKTTLATQIVASWQKQGMSCAYIDVENAMRDKSYFELLGADTSNLWYVGHKFNPDGSLKEALRLEDVFNIIREISDIYDLIVVDSIDALVRKSEAEKSADENSQQGGIAKKLGEFLRVNTARKSTIIWINQMRQSMAFNPTGNTTYVTSGGRAMLFYGGIRLELAPIEKLGDKDQYYGFVTEVKATKNKCGGKQWYSCKLNYIYGEGFSVVYDRLKWALANKIIIKSGAWFSSDQLDIKVQGEKKLYEKLKSNEDNCLDRLTELMSGIKTELEEVIDIDE